jgi:hypothetical protein
VRTPPQLARREIEDRAFSEELQEFVGGHFRIWENLAKQTAADVVRPVCRHRYYAPVRVPEAEVATFLAHLLKAGPSECAQDLSRPQ